MGDLIGKDPMSVYPELGCAIVRANKIKDIVGTAAEMEIEGKCREMLKSCAGPRIDPLAEEALWLLKREAMVDVLAQADEVGYTSADIDEIRAKLALSEEAFVKLQLKKANELNDPDRVINREIKLKELYLDAYGSMFTLDKFSLLRDPDEWASMKLFGFAFNKDQIAASFLYHTSSPIHASLTNLESPLSKEAVKVRRCCVWLRDYYNYEFIINPIHPSILSNILSIFRRCSRTSWDTWEIASTPTPTPSPRKSLPAASPPPPSAPSSTFK